MALDKITVCRSFLDRCRNEVVCSCGIILTSNDEVKEFVASTIYLRLDIINEFIHVTSRVDHHIANLCSIPMEYIKSVKTVRIGRSTECNYFMSVHLSKIFQDEVPIYRLYFYVKNSESYENVVARINAYIKRRDLGLFLNNTVLSKPLDPSIPAYNTTLADESNHDESFGYRRHSILLAEAGNLTQDTHNETLGLRRSKRKRVLVYPDLNFGSPEKPKEKRRKRNKNYRANRTI